MSECFKCKGHCCRYITVDIAAPRSAEDYDEIRWYLLHNNVIVYKPEKDRGWRLEFRTPCKYFNKYKYTCKKYEKRPDVCREYITDECGKEHELTNIGCDLYFETENDLKKYLDVKKPKVSKIIFYNSN